MELIQNVETTPEQFQAVQLTPESFTEIITSDFFNGIDFTANKNACSIKIYDQMAGKGSWIVKRKPQYPGMIPEFKTYQENQFKHKFRPSTVK